MTVEQLMKALERTKAECGPDIPVVVRGGESGAYIDAKIAAPTTGIPQRTKTDWMDRTVTEWSRHFSTDDDMTHARQVFAIDYL